MGICENCGAKEVVDKNEFDKFNDSYHTAVRDMNAGTLEGYKAAAEIFEEIPFMYDSRMRLRVCSDKIDELESAIEISRKQEQEYNNYVLKKAKTKRLMIKALIVFVLLTVVSSLYVFKLYLPQKFYEKAASYISECDIESIDLYRSRAAKLNSSTKLAEELNEDIYLHSKALANEENYKDALALMSLIPDYKDGTELIGKYSALLNEQTYNKACDLYSNGKYTQAFNLFKSIVEYKDAKAFLKKIDVMFEKIRIRGFNVGDTLTFGQYNKSETDKESIEWIVLYKSDRSMLIVSKYGLDTVQYNSTYQKVKWVDCTLRDWLDTGFRSAAFTEVENSVISDSSRVSIPSIDQFNKYFVSSLAKECLAGEFATINHADVCPNKKYFGNCRWWIASADYTKNAPFVDYDGSIKTNGKRVDYDGFCLRPIIWIDTDISP